MTILRITPQVTRITRSTILSFSIHTLRSRGNFTFGIPLGVTISFLLQGSIVVPFFPKADSKSIVIVMFLERPFTIKMPALPIPYRMVIFIIAVRFHFLVTIKRGPLSVAQSFFIVSEQGHIAKARPTFKVTMRNAVLVRDFQFLDAIGVPFVPFQDFTVRVYPNRSLFRPVRMLRKHGLLGSFHGTS